MLRINIMHVECAFSVLKLSYEKAFYSSIFNEVNTHVGTIPRFRVLLSFLENESPVSFRGTNCQGNERNSSVPLKGATRGCTK